MYQITCKRWFQKSYGNTYHSVEIRVKKDKNLIARNDFTYGYGEQCLQTGLEMLVRSNLIDKKFLKMPTWKAFEELGIEYSIEDVNRKKDL